MTSPENPIEVSRDVLVEAFSTLSSFEITWHHERECRDWWDNMYSLAQRAYEVSEKIEQILNRNGIPTTFSADELGNMKGVLPILTEEDIIKGEQQVKDGEWISLEDLYRELERD